MQTIIQTAFLLAKILFMLLSLAIFGSLRTQKPDFSGKWVIKDQQSISGTLYTNGVPKQMTVTQNETQITIEKISDKGDGEEITVTDVIGLNGMQVNGTTLSKKRKKLSLKWSDDKNSLIASTEIYSPSDSTKLEHKDTDVWSLDDGNLVLVRKDENLLNGETWEEKAIYQKQ